MGTTVSCRRGTQALVCAGSKRGVGAHERSHPFLLGDPLTWELPRRQAGHGQDSWGRQDAPPPPACCLFRPMTLEAPLNFSRLTPGALLRHPLFSQHSHK